MKLPANGAGDEVDDRDADTLLRRLVRDVLSRDVVQCGDREPGQTRGDPLELEAHRVS